MWLSQTLVQMKRALTATLVFAVIAPTLVDEVADHRGTDVSSGGVSGRRLRSLADINTGQMNKTSRYRSSRILENNPQE